MADIVGVSKVGVCMSYGNEKQVDEDAPMRTRRKPKVYIWTLQMYPWQQLCQGAMINKPNDIFIPVVEKVGFQISEDEEESMCGKTTVNKLHRTLSVYPVVIE